MIIIQKTFEQWLQTFDAKITIREHPTNPDIDLLYYKNQRLGSVPKGLGKKRDWNISDLRADKGYKTSDGIMHRSLSGVGTLLFGCGAITLKQFMDNFFTKRNKEALAKIAKKGSYTRKSGLTIPI